MDGKVDRGCARQLRRQIDGQVDLIAHPDGRGGLKVQGVDLRGGQAVQPDVSDEVDSAGHVLAEFQRMSNLLRRPTRGDSTPSDEAAPDLPPMEALTPREETILRLLTEGLTNAGIADRLQLSEGTVKNHVSEILSKLHANDRTHAVVLAIKRGLLDLT